MLEEKYWIWLTKLNLSPKNVINYLEEHNIEKLWNAKEEEICKYFNKIEITNIINSKFRENLSSHEKYLKKYGIKLISIKNRLYPRKLRYIEEPPIALYAIGNLEIFKEKNIAIVGARKCTDYGKTVAQAFSYSLSKQNIVITSGLALGVDRAAHEGTVLANGKTIAVVGTGLDIIYPKENKEIFKEIIKSNGLIVSEYPLETKPERQNFPRRNRIISALCDGVLVVEAGGNSGALITVDYALEQGKNIYAIPR